MRLCNEKNCTSCLACLNSCPFGAIELIDGPLSVKLPRINADICKNCGLCLKVCPQLNNSNLIFSAPQKAYACYTKIKSDRETCSSGGVATALSRHIIRQGGVVFGAAVMNGYPNYISVEKEEDLELLKGSKYVHCDTGKIYQKVKEKLITGRKCLFIGTACQIAGLYNYIKKRYDNLTTIDLICHGTPPFEYLKKHLTSKLGRYDHVESFSFRGKHDFSLVVKDRNDKVIYKCSQYEDEYFIAFMKGVLHKPCCYECIYAQRKRISDITIGDYWGLLAHPPIEYTGKKSCVLANTQKGMILLQQCVDLVYHERSTDEAIAGNDQLRHPTPITKLRKQFVQHYSTERSIKKVWMKTGIVTISKYYYYRNLLLYIPRKVKNFLNKK